jgi:hypothetical protein
MVIDIRELAGRDGRYLTNPKLVRDNEVEDFVLKSCTSLVDPGPAYDGKFKGDTIDWPKVLVGDRSFAFIAIREETFPSSDELFYFRVTCGNGACRNSEKPFEWGIDLAKFLAKKTRRLTPEAAATFAESNRFEARMPSTKDPRAFWFKLGTGEDQKRMAMFIEQRNASKKKHDDANRMLDAIVASIVEIEGVPKNRAAIVEYLEALSFRTIDALIPLIEEPNCGVETTLVVRCPKCETRREIELPFGRSFLLPKSSKRLEESSADEVDDEGEAEDEMAATGE